MLLRWDDWLSFGVVLDCGGTGEWGGLRGHLFITLSFGEDLLSDGQNVEQRGDTVHSEHGGCARNIGGQGVGKVE